MWGTGKNQARKQGYGDGSQADLPYDRFFFTSILIPPDIEQRYMRQAHQRYPPFHVGKKENHLASLRFLSLDHSR